MLENNDTGKTSGFNGTQAPSVEVQLRGVMRRKQMSLRTEDTYVG